MVEVNDILRESHILIGGCTGCGKSTLTNRILWELVHDKNNLLVLVDNKLTEYKPYKHMPNTLYYCTSINDTVNALEWTLEEIVRRGEIMQRDIFCREYTGKHIYILIDELADLMATAETKKRILPLLQRIAQIGRAFRIHLICCTQNATKQTIGTVKNNITCQIALRCSNRQESKNIIGINGAENISQFGVAYIHYKGLQTKLHFEPVRDSDVLAYMKQLKLI